MCGRLVCDGVSPFYVKKKCGGGILKVPVSVSEPCRCLSLASVIMDTARDSYAGTSRKLVVALDIGTTFSGAAYTLLDPGQVPRIQSVTRQVFSPVSNRVTGGDEWETDTRTLRILGPQKYPPYCITIATVVFVASKMGRISRMMMSSCR